MKARIKSTGEIIEVDFHMETKRGKMFGEVTDSKRLCKPDSSYRKFYRDEIEFLSYEDTPDYWTRLEHTYAGMAMQGVVNTFNNRYRDSCALRPNITRDQSEILLKESARATAEVCYYFAHALVEKLKSE